MIKRMFVVFMMVAVFLSLNPSVYASELRAGINVAAISNEYTTIQPLYDYTASHVTNLTISGGTASCKASLTGYSGTTSKIEITMTLQKKTLLWWSNVESWTGTYNTYYGSLTKSKAVDSGTYRVKAVYKVYSGSKSETITGYSAEKKI